MRALFASLALLLAACGDNRQAPPDGTVPADADTGARTACLDRPTDLALPPTGALSCDMLPPGLTLEAP